MPQEVAMELARQRRLARQRQAAYYRLKPGPLNALMAAFERLIDLNDQPVPAGKVTFRYVEPDATVRQVKFVPNTLFRQAGEWWVQGEDEDLHRSVTFNLKYIH